MTIAQTCIVLLLALPIGCTQTQNPNELRERTAQETAELKKQTEEATAEARRDSKAVVEGIREGWNRDKPLNLNSATKDELLSLPGMTSTGADRVIAGRPYKAADEIVTRHILPPAEYDKIADRVTAK